MSQKKLLFIVDAMLGNLAKKLRVLGYDSAYFSSIEDEKLVTIAKNEKRIILTKDEQLCKTAQNQGMAAVLIRGNDELEQIMQIHQSIKFENFVMDTNNSRCIVCNGKLQQVEKYRTIGKIPEGVLEREEKFWMCDGCKKIYWQGTHFEKLQEFVNKLNNRLQ
ncbi:MAG TPA: Mut7-C RNAse domain-containing protein [Nitrosopumilaceae archaeon]|nr:Mut7-C RNAse domain-containing protein [Nitrosopumilaceae archaeon]